MVSSHSDLDGMDSIPASPDARNVPLLLCQERFNGASLSDQHKFFDALRLRVVIGSLPHMESKPTRN